MRSFGIYNMYLILLRSLNLKGYVELIM